MHKIDLKSCLWLRYNDTMNCSRSFLYAVLAATLLVSACAGQPETPPREQPETPLQEQSQPSTQGLLEPQAPPEKPIHEQPLPLPECERYRLADFSMLDRIFFNFDSAALRLDAIDQIDKWVDLYMCFPDMKFMIEGHTDARGPRDYNHDLGCRRARAARGALIERGIPAERMRTVSYGEDRPAVIGDNEDAWSQNRRAIVVETGELGESNCGGKP